jgi:membrane protease YdiL (CAAX protease family)
VTDPAGTDPAGTDPAGRRVPRRGSVADGGVGCFRVSTAPGSFLVGGLVVAGGLAFLLVRPAVGGLPSAVPLLATGYLALAAGALAVRVPRGAAVAPLGWAVPLALGLVAVAGVTAVAGPAPDRRVGAAAAGLVLLATVAEEALFRRLLYRRLEQFGQLVAVLGTAVLFALIHLPAYGLAAMPVDLGAALLLSWQRYASGRWTVPAVTHAVANLLAVR